MSAKPDATHVRSWCGRTDRTHPVNRVEHFKRRPRGTINFNYQYMIIQFSSYYYNFVFRTLFSVANPDGPEGRSPFQIRELFVSGKTRSTTVRLRPAVRGQQVREQDRERPRAGVFGLPAPTEKVAKTVAGRLSRIGGGGNATDCTPRFHCPALAVGRLHRWPCTSWWPKGPASIQKTANRNHRTVADREATGRWKVLILNCTHFLLHFVRSRRVMRRTSTERGAHHVTCTSNGQAR